MLALFLGLFCAGAVLAGETPAQLISTLSGTTDTGTTSTATGTGASTNGTVTASTTTAAASQSSSAAPTLATDQPDYIAGATVTLTGASWDPTGGAVHVVVNDDA